MRYGPSRNTSSSTEIGMLSYIHGSSWDESERNEGVRKLAGRKAISLLIRKIWIQMYGHVCRTEEGEDVKRVANFIVRNGGITKDRWKDTINSGMRV